MLEAKTLEPNGSVPSGLIRAAGHKEKSLSAIIKEGRLTVVPELASRIILECPYERQRTVTPLHVSVLAVQMRKKEFTPGMQLHFARLVSDGWLILVNGQNRLHAVVEANTSIEFQVLITDCKNMTEVHELYRRHDRTAKPRTIENVLTSEGIPAKYGISAYFARGVFNAALIIDSGFAFSHRTAKSDPYLFRSDEARLRLCKPWWTFAEDFAEIINSVQGKMTPQQSKVRKHLSAGSAMSLALITLRDQNTKADTFWRGIALDDGLRRDDPRAAYIRFVTGERGKLGGFGAAKGASIAWNAFCEGRKLIGIRLTDAPIQIVGCTLEA